jgi:hypothetical protein
MSEKNCCRNDARSGCCSPATLAGALAMIFILSWCGECWAYIDPNAGGFLWQILAPLASIFVSFLFYCRNEIRKLAKSIRNRWKKTDPDGAEPGVRR